MYKYRKTMLEALDEVYNYDQYKKPIEEKAESEAQQKLMGMAYALKKGELDPADVSDKVKELADKMSLKDLKDFASTKHDKLPKKVEGVTDASTADVIGKYFGDEDDEEIKKWTKVDTREEIEPSTRGDDLKALKDAQLQKRLTQAQAQVAKWQEVVQRITNIQNVKKEQEKNNS